MSLSRQGRNADAERCYGEALQRNPENAEAHWNRALTLLSNGDYGQGWAEYEWRFKRDKWQSFYPYRHQVPRWNGRSFQGRRLLVHDEQGLGDTLQFLRYLPMVKARGGTVMYPFVACRPSSAPCGIPFRTGYLICWPTLPW